MPDATELRISLRLTLPPVFFFYFRLHFLLLQVKTGVLRGDLPVEDLPDCPEILLRHLQAGVGIQLPFLAVTELRCKQLHHPFFVALKNGPEQSARAVLEVPFMIRMKFL